MKKGSDAIIVRMAFLHQSITWPGAAGSEKSISAQKIKGLRMKLIPQGLLMEVAMKGVEHVCLVPHANVANYVLESAPE